MTNIFRLLFLIVTLFFSSCSAPRPPKVSLTGKVEPINFECQNNYDDATVIKSEKQKINGYSSKQFAFFLDEKAEYSPEFFYYITHADKIIAKIKPPFVDFMYEKIIENLRSYGAAANIELLIEEKDDENDLQVILECIRYKN